MNDFTHRYSERAMALETLLALIENPTCHRGVTSWLQQDQPPSHAWYPQASFLNWALSSDNLRPLFDVDINIIESKQSRPFDASMLRNGDALAHQTFTLTIAGKDISICPDLILKKNDLLHVLNFCCHPYRGGYTSPYVLRKARLKIALFQSLLPPESYSSKAFLIFHRWKKLHLLSEDIDYEQQHVAEALASLRQFDPRPPTKSASFRLQRSCRFSCSQHSTCEREAIENGAAYAYSSRLPNLLGNTSIEHARQLLSGERRASSPNESHLQNRLTQLQSIHERLFSK